MSGRHVEVKQNFTCLAFPPLAWFEPIYDKWSVGCVSEGWGIVQGGVVIMGRLCHSQG